MQNFKDKKSLFLVGIFLPIFLAYSYTQTFTADFSSSATFVFASPNKSKLKERTLLQVCKKIATNAGITSRAFLHKFRHTFATHLVRNRVPLERVQKLLGHTSITETLIYAHLIPNDMHDDVRVLNVLN